MVKKIKVKYEFKLYDRNQTIVLNNPSQVQFINISNVPGGLVIINNFLTLNSVRDSITGFGPPPNPSQITLNNNTDEEDTTNYTCQFPANEGILLVIAKYYES